MTGHSEKTKWYTVDSDGNINGGGTDNRSTAEMWLDKLDDVHDLIAAKNRVQARRKYVDD